MNDRANAVADAPVDSDGAGNLLDVTDLRTWFPSAAGWVRAVDGVSLRVAAGEAVGVVGESGSGKSVMALSLLRLLPRSARITGSVKWLGRELLGAPDVELRRIRGRDVAMVFQDPMAHLNPVVSIGDQVVERLRVEERLGSPRARTRAIELLDLVGIPDAARRVNSYPHEYSGGMRQRAMIAMALACGPKLLIADEPTTALDVTVQAQILDLLTDLRRRLGMALVLITHDLGIAAGNCDRVMVMYAGRIVESASVDQLFDSPQMPYTQGLLASIPRMSDPIGTPLRTIDGLPPPATNSAPGCRFAERCAHTRSRCVDAEPLLSPRGVDPGHSARCWATEPGGWL